VDHSVFHLINQQWTSPALDLFMAGLSDAAIWRPFFVGIGLGALLFGRFRARSLVICLALSLSIAGQVTSALKSTVDRRRPKQVQTVRMVQLQKANPKFLTFFKPPTIRYSDSSDRNRSGPSFPSGHVTSNTIIAVFLTFFYPRRGWLYWFVTVAIAYSRIYLGAHWPSDVIATVFLGIGESLLLLALFEFIWRTMGRKWMPAIFSRHPSLIAGHASSSPSDSPARGSRYCP
jgi:undecaprenyl-diphosphatase